MDTPMHADDRANAIDEVAREALGNIELRMSHPATEYAVSAAELRRALELAYDRGAAMARPQAEACFAEQERARAEAG